MISGLGTWLMASLIFVAVVAAAAFTAFFCRIAGGLVRLFWHELDRKRRGELQDIAITAGMAMIACGLCGFCVRFLFWALG